MSLLLNNLQNKIDMVFRTLFLRILFLHTLFPRTSFLFAAAIIMILIIPHSFAIGIGPGLVTVDYVPGKTETVSMLALNDIDQQSMFTVSSSVEHITCTPDKFTISPMSNADFTCTLTIPTLDLPPGVHEIGRVRLSEVAPVGVGVGAVGAVVSIFRVNVPNDGPYLSAGVDVQNVPQGQQVSGKLSIANAGTEPVDSVQGTLDVVDVAGSHIFSIPPFIVGPFALGERKDYPLILPTEQLKSGNYRAMVDIPYNGKNAHAESWFKIGEKRIAIKQFAAEPTAPGGILRAELETESFWSEELAYRIDFIIRKNGQEINSVRDRLENIAPWAAQKIPLYWETKTTPPGMYDVRIVLRYDKKEEQKDFPDAISIAVPELPAAKHSWRKPVLIVIGVLILLLLIALILILRKKQEQHKKHEQH